MVLVLVLVFNNYSPKAKWILTIAQLLPARRLCLFDFATWKSKYITKHLMYGPSGNKLV